MNPALPSSRQQCLWNIYQLVQSAIGWTRRRRLLKVQCLIRLQRHCLDYSGKCGTQCETECGRHQGSSDLGTGVSRTRMMDLVLMPNGERSSRIVHCALERKNLALWSSEALVPSSDLPKQALRAIIRTSVNGLRILCPMRWNR